MRRQTVAAFVKGTVEPRDVEGAPDATHDFDIVSRAGQRVALEVTAAADHARLSLDAAAFGKEWTAPTLTNDWWLVLSRRVVRTPVRFSSLMTEIIALLEVMEP